MFTRDAHFTLHSLVIVVLDFDDAKIVSSIKDLIEIRCVHRHGDMLGRCT